ncbi:MAG: pilus assembly protein PilP, partial [Nitrospirota bacterium]
TIMRRENKILNLALILIIILLFLPFTGCKKEQAVIKKPVAEKVQPAEETRKDIKAPEEVKKAEQEVYSYDARGRRDPFLPLVAASKEKPTKKKGASPVESYSIDEITLIAIAWDKQKHYALIMLPDKKSYTITEGMSLGLHGGKVQKITRDTVLIREYVKDYRGDMKPRDVVLKLHKGEEE